MIRAVCTAATLAFVSTMASASQLDCNNSDVAAFVLDVFNYMLDKNPDTNKAGLRVMSMTNVSTLHDPELELVCHGEYLFNNGSRIVGTLSIKKDASGNYTPAWNSDD